MAKDPRMVNTPARKMSLNSQSSYQFEHLLRLLDHLQKSKNSEGAQISCFWKIQLWWAITSSRDPMKSTIWIPRTVRELARDFWTRSRDSANVSRQCVLPVNIENNSRKPIRSCTKRDPYATSPRSLTPLKKDSHTSGSTVRNMSSPKMFWKPVESCFSNSKWYSR